MYIAVFIVVLTEIVLSLAFTFPVKVSFLLNSDAMDMRLSMSWLSLFEAEIKASGGRANISLFISKNRICSLPAAKKNTTDRSVLRALSISGTKIKICYGLNSPHLTGILYSAICMLGSLINIKDLQQYPEFLPHGEYLRIEAGTYLNMGKTLTELLKIKLRKTKGAKQHELIKFN